jgi:hypothetical protein
MWDVVFGFAGTDRRWFRSINRNKLDHEPEVNLKAGIIEKYKSTNQRVDKAAHIEGARPGERQTLYACCSNMRLMFVRDKSTTPAKRGSLAGASSYGNLLRISG